jgi:FtsH-binding integral membrane protein
MRNEEAWWRVGMFAGTAFMAVSDALTTQRSHVKVELWVVVLFLELVLTVFILNHPRTLKARAKLVLWVVGCFLGPYTLVWAAVTSLHETLPAAVSLYPFGFAVGWGILLVFVAAGVWLLYLTKDS